MSQLYVILLFTLTNCHTLQIEGENNRYKKFDSIIESYMNKYPEIQNKCGGKPYYKVFFMKTDSGGIGFWVAGHLGEPGSVELIEPGTTPPLNPIEIKGVIMFNKRPLVIYDFKDSDGYGLYDPSKVKAERIKKIESIPDGCGHVWHPEAWYFTVEEDSLYKTDIREPFKPQ